jgi:hypothetical protein
LDRSSTEQTGPDLPPNLFSFHDVSANPEQLGLTRDCRKQVQRTPLPSLHPIPGWDFPAQRELKNIRSVDAFS